MLRSILPLTVFLLDGVSTSATGAYSTRKVRAGYTGSAVRVRRSSDDAEADVGFGASGELNTTALLDHVTVGGAQPTADGYVRTWYNQSLAGSSRDMAQSDPTQQPRIVSGGAVITSIGGKPSIEFDGVDDKLTSALNISNFITAAQGTVAASVRFSNIAIGSTLNNRPIFCDLGQQWYGPTAGDGQMGIRAADEGGFKSLSVGGSTGTNFMLVAGHDPTVGLFVYRDGGSPATLTFGTGLDGAGAAAIGGEASFRHHDGHILEVVTFAASLYPLPSELNFLSNSMANYAGIVWTNA